MSDVIEFVFRIKRLRAVCLCFLLNLTVSTRAAVTEQVDEVAIDSPAFILDFHENDRDATTPHDVIGLQGAIVGPTIHFTLPVDTYEFRIYRRGGNDGEFE